MADKVTPVTIKGRYFWKGDERFLVNGVVYQPLGRNKGGSRTSYPDPLAEDQLEDLERSILLFKELGLNTIFVYLIDENKSHDAAMDMLAEAGIYVLACLSTPRRAIKRNAPFESYTADLLQQSFKVVDCMAAYRNTLGVIVANEVVNSIPSTIAAPVIRAVARDKKYMALASDSAGQRVLPAGISSADVASLLMPQFEYFCGGDEEGSLDFFSFNNYSWAGKASMSTSGYEAKAKIFSQSHVPVFFSEYGTNVNSPRIFQETRAIYNEPTMTKVFSGGIVYEFSLGPNNYGLVRQREDGSLEPLQDFKNLKASLQSCTVEPTTIDAFASSESKSLKRPEMPKPGDHWRAEQPVPESPLDWDEVQALIEDGQWVDVEQEIQELAVDDLAASIWERFRVDGTGPRWG